MRRRRATGAAPATGRACGDSSTPSWRGTWTPTRWRGPGAGSTGRRPRARAVRATGRRCASGWRPPRTPTPASPASSPRCTAADPSGRPAGLLGSDVIGREFRCLVGRGLLGVLGRRRLRAGSRCQAPAAPLAFDAADSEQALQGGADRGDLQRLVVVAAGRLDLGDRGTFGRLAQDLDQPPLERAAPRPRPPPFRRRLPGGARRTGRRRWLGALGPGGSGRCHDAPHRVVVAALVALAPGGLEERRQLVEEEIVGHVAPPSRSARPRAPSPWRRSPRTRGGGRSPSRPRCRTPPRTRAGAPAGAWSG